MSNVSAVQTKNAFRKRKKGDFYRDLRWNARGFTQKQATTLGHGYWPNQRGIICLGGASWNWHGSYGRRFFSRQLLNETYWKAHFYCGGVLVLVHSEFNRFRVKREVTTCTAKDFSPPKTIATSFRRHSLWTDGSFGLPGIGSSRPTGTTEVLLIFRYCRTSLVERLNESDRRILNDNTTVIITNCLVENTAKKAPCTSTFRTIPRPDYKRHA